MERGKKEHWIEHGVEEFKKAHDSTYFAGFHRGRHKQRENWANSEWVQIKPDKLEEVKRFAYDPCEGCTERADYLKIGCKANPKECSLKQKQLLAIELLTYLNK